MFLFKTHFSWPFPSCLVQELRLVFAPLSSGYLARCRHAARPARSAHVQSLLSRPHSAASERAGLPPAPSSGSTEQEPREGLEPRVPSALPGGHPRARAHLAPASQRPDRKGKPGERRARRGLEAQTQTLQGDRGTALSCPGRP